MRWLKRLLGSDDDASASSDDPRSTDEYRTADPREIVEHAGTAMAGPGGAPQEGLSPQERRELDRRDD